MANEWTKIDGDPIPSDWDPTGLPADGEWTNECGCESFNPEINSTVDTITLTGKPGKITGIPWRLTFGSNAFTVDHLGSDGAFIASPLVINDDNSLSVLQDPVDPLDIATKRYVDAKGGVPEAPNTGLIYGREGDIQTWLPVTEEAPVDGQLYGRILRSWVVVPPTPDLTAYMPISGGTFTGVVHFPSNNSVTIDGAAGTSHAILGRVGPLTRWQIQLGDTTAEGVGNVGSNFSLTAFSAAGGFLGNWLTIARADGTTALNGAAVNVAGSMSINGILFLSNVGNLSIPGGTNGQVLTTNGSGLLSWTTPSGGGGGASVSVGDTAPATPRVGDLWWDSAGGQLYVWYADANSSQWVAASNSTGSAGGGGLADAPNDGKGYARQSAAWLNTPSFQSVLLGADPTVPLAAATKQYVDNNAGGPLPSSGLPLINAPVAASGTSLLYTRADHVHPTDTTRLALAGGTLTGRLFLANDPSLALETASLRSVQTWASAENKIINGDMRIDQRNAGAAVNNGLGSPAMSVDRWGGNGSIAAKYSMQQMSTGGPAGFPYFVRITALTTFTLAAGDYFSFASMFEADTVADMGFGTAAASYWSLSFWIRASVAGNYSASLASAGGTRSYVFQFNVAAANTWQRITVQTQIGDTTGTWVASGNGAWGNLRFDLGSGTSFRSAAGWQAGNFVGITGTQSAVITTGRTLDITGVKFENNLYCSVFQRKSLAASLVDCQRYYQTGQLYSASGASVPAGTVVSCSSLCPVVMRANATMAVSNNSNNNITTPTLGHNGNMFSLIGNATATGAVIMNMVFTASAEI